ncbi:hypothetical protein FJD32_025080 (plasmid) [Shewanella sp. LC6]|nr:hypothetical protein FJD32_025080 [Shewanella sp. LC6]TPE64142.1 hypothetical protein FJD33_03320 [Shewanella sp. LC2]
MACPQSFLVSVCFDDKLQGECRMQQKLHVYDDHAGIIYLADGREVKFDPKLYSSAYLAHSEAVKWAKETGVIGQDDDVVMFVH